MAKLYTQTYRVEYKHPQNVIAGFRFRRMGSGSLDSWFTCLIASYLQELSSCIQQSS